MSGKARTSRERRYGAVLYAEFSGSTALSEVLDPEEIHEIMTECLALLERSALEHGASLVKYRPGALEVRPQAERSISRSEESP